MLQAIVLALIVAATAPIWSPLLVAVFGAFMGIALSWPALLLAVCILPFVL
jgi:hypothetical protein